MAPDRGLQLVRDVGDEVVADLLGAGDFGAVIGQQEDVFLAQQGRPDLDDDGPLAQRAARQLELRSSITPSRRTRPSCPAVPGAPRCGPRTRPKA